MFFLDLNAGLRNQTPCLSPLDFWNIECHSIFFQFRNIKFENQKINLISELIFAGYTGSKNQVRTQQISSLFRNRFFFQVCNKLPNWLFKNQAQIDTAIVNFWILNPVFTKIQSTEKLLKPLFFQVNHMYHHWHFNL